jgi:hypothetical protein
VFNPNLALLLAMTETPQKWGIRLLNIDRGILDEARLRKHTYEAYKDKIKVENIIIALFKDYKIKK